MTDDALDTRRRIVRAARELLTVGGRDAVSTRAVSAAAGVQAPTIYRQFGDMRGLLDAVARDVLSDYIADKASAERTDDPVADLRCGFLHHVAFGLANPAAYQLIFSDPETSADMPARLEGQAILLAQITRLAEAGRLTVTVEHAARLIYSAGRGVALTLIGEPEAERDAGLATTMCDAVLRAILADNSAESTAADVSPDNRVAARAVALRAVLADASGVLSPAEGLMMSEWLDRLATKHKRAPN